MTANTPADIEALKKVGSIAADCMQHMFASIRDGMTTADLDHLGAEFLAKHGARSAPVLTYRFPGATCISLNHEAAHGIPSARKRIHSGDLVNIDVSCELDGFFADTGGSRIFGNTNERLERLCRSTQDALAKSIAVVKPGRPLNLIGRTIQDHARTEGFSVILNLTSHGVGRALHEYPDHILHVYDPNDKRVIEENLVFTIEPFLGTGGRYVSETDDEWTLVNEAGHYSAQYEHTLIATSAGAMVVTLGSNGKAGWQV